MSDRMFVRLPAQADGELQWLWQHQGQWTSGIWSAPADLKRWAAAHADLPCTLLVPAGHEGLVQLTATLKQRREAGSALVALAEDQVGEDYERLHWVLEPGAGDEVLARGVRADWLGAWLALARDAGLNVDGVLPEALLYSVDEASWLWLPADGEVYLAVGQGQAALYPADAAAELLAGWRTRQSFSAPVRLRHPQGVAVPALPEGIQPVPVPWQDWRDLARQQPARFWQRHPQNWLHGAFAPRAAVSVDSRWRWVAVAVAVFLVVQVGLDRWQAGRLRAQTEQMLGEVEMRYRQLFPQDRNTTDLDRLITARMRGGAGAGLPQLLEQLAETAPAQPWVIDKVSYRSRGASEIEVSGGQLGGLEQWAAALSAAGVPARVLNSRVEGDTVHARLELQASGSSR